MFISHYDKSFISCSNEQFDMLMHATSGLFEICGKFIYEHWVIDAFFANDNIYYSGQYLFSSKKPLKELYPRYCSLAKLIYMYYDTNNEVYETELNCIVANMSVDLDVDLIYSQMDKMYR